MQFVQIGGAINAYQAHPAQTPRGETVAELGVRRAGDDKGDAELLGGAFDATGEIDGVSQRAVVEFLFAAGVAAQSLEVQYNGKSIGDVLESTIKEAAEFFRAQPRIHKALELLSQTGLGYLQLGQPSPTLSGGEAQRLKLVSELKAGVSKGLTERLRRNLTPKSTLYLLEEPTIGLHMADVQLLVEVLHRLVDDGNTVIVIEHNLDVIAEADYIVDIGPEAGEAGGRVVTAGPPDAVARDKHSRTAPFVRKVLESQKTSRRSGSPDIRRAAPIGEKNR